MQRWIIGTIIVLLLVAAGIFLAKQQEDGTPTPTESPTTESPTPTPTETTSLPTASPTPTETAAPLIELTFGTPTKSAHYVSNTPVHAEILTAAPKEVVIRFNFDLAAPSTISIMKDKIEYGRGDTKISADKRSLSRSVADGIERGVYTVLYTACWPDGSCHDGQFQFGIE